jgi:hypothetical protein
VYASLIGKRIKPGLENARRKRRHPGREPKLTPTLIRKGNLEPMRLSFVEEPERRLLQLPIYVYLRTCRPRNPREGGQRDGIFPLH